MKEKDNSKEMIKQKSVDLIAPMLESIERMNDNFAPMLESIERINDSLAPFISPMLENIERINDNLAPIFQQAFESWSQMREEFSYEYDGIQTQFNSYFDKEGIVRPKDVDEFLYWLLIKNPDIPMWELIDEAKRPYNYNLFHEYKVKCLKEDWNLGKEFGYWEKNDDPRRGIKREASLSDIITHPKSNEIVEGIKIQYKNIRGKRLKLLLLAFQELGMLPKERIAQRFYDCCKSEFNWDIASYQAMNDYKFNDSKFNTDETELYEMKQYLENLINPK